MFTTIQASDTMAFADKLFETVKGVAKVALQSRPCSRFKGRAEGRRLIIMANGPSLSQTIADSADELKSTPTMAVNFAAIAPEFTSLKPRYYVLADPHFFTGPADDTNLSRLRTNLAAVDWPMTLFVPVKYGKQARTLYGNIDIATFNSVGVEGFAPLCHAAFRAGMAMPRPRNVLIPSLMLAIAMGYAEIVVVGADHTWMQTLSVTDDNEVVSVQPHFYNDGKDEQARVRHEYRNYRLHQIVESFAVAFKSYHDIANFAASRGVSIINATPGSFIDAFPRGSLSGAK